MSEPDEVWVALKRIEGYEDVHPQILAEDAIPNWPEWRLIERVDFQVPKCPHGKSPHAWCDKCDPEGEG